MSSERITAKHRSRLAVVYVRQSTERQVRECTESQRRQRQLSVRARTRIAWGDNGSFAPADGASETHRSIPVLVPLSGGQGD